MRMTLKNYKRVLTAQILFLAAVSLVANYFSLDESKFPYTFGGIFGMMFGTIAHVWIYRVEPETKIVEKTIEVPVEKTADFETTLAFDYGNYVDTIFAKNVSRMEFTTSTNTVTVHASDPATCTRYHRHKVIFADADHTQNADKNSAT